MVVINIDIICLIFSKRQRSEVMSTINSKRLDYLDYIIVLVTILSISFIFIRGYYLFPITLFIFKYIRKYYKVRKYEKIRKLNNSEYSIEAGEDIIEFLTERKYIVLYCSLICVISIILSIFVQSLIDNYTKVLEVILTDFYELFKNLFYNINSRLLEVLLTNHDKMVEHTKLYFLEFIDIVAILYGFLKISQFLASNLTYYIFSHFIEYDFSMSYILSRKDRFRLRVWNYIMYQVKTDKENLDEINQKVTIRKIRDGNRILIDNQDYRKFKDKLKIIPTNCLENIIFYDNLPVFKQTDSSEIDKIFTQPEDGVRYILPILTIILPILIEKNFNIITSYFSSKTIISIGILLVIIYHIILFIWNFFRWLNFVEKRRQIDSFFNRDINEELENRKKN